MKPSIPKGMRDFGPAEVLKRKYIFDTIQKVFKKYGYQPIETPTMENLTTLTGKYGDEGDQLIFKVLNSGDYLSKSDTAKGLIPQDSKKFTFQISEKALRYDLTVPFARFVVMHQNELAFPFKRYQIQPVWRADRPQKGRYREFYQCDADVVGSDSLLNEAEFISIYAEALTKLGLKDFTIKLNNRKILASIATLIGAADRMMDMTIAIDKLDKIGMEGVRAELLNKGFTEQQIHTIESFLGIQGTSVEKINALKTLVNNEPQGIKGIEELEEVLHLYHLLGGNNALVGLDFTLARGLNYYTGAIFEVKTNEVEMGSIGGGGRYDDLTGMFGLKGLSGVGISFGADRIYDVLEALQLFPTSNSISTEVLFTNNGNELFEKALNLASSLRLIDISTEVYPSEAKLQKQLKYANDKQIKFVVILGEEELKQENVSVKNMHTGEQVKVEWNLLPKYIETQLHQVL